MNLLTAARNALKTLDTSGQSVQEYVLCEILRDYISLKQEEERGWIHDENCDCSFCKHSSS